MLWRNIRFRKRALGSALAAALVAAAAPQLLAHEVPADVTIRAFVKPEGNVLRTLYRVPLGAMRDMNLPLSGPGFIVFGQEQEHIEDAAEIWLANYMRIYEDGRLLGDERITAARVSLPSDQSFGSYESALAHLYSAPIDPSTELIWDQAMLDVLIEYPIQSADSEFSMDPALSHLGIRTNTILTFLPPSGAERVYQYTGDPGLVRLDPGWFHAASTFVRLGFLHILGGLDHLLFVFCLVIPFRRIRPLLVVVTSFTVAHSITLIAAAMGLAPRALWFPPLIETLIALSIVYMAFENIVGAKVERRWMMAFGFGLIHGFGFSFLLTESLQFAGAHLLTSLLAFNVGVELGQIMVLLAAIPVLEMLFRKVMPERVGTIILSALIAHTAWHWMLERGSSLAAYDFVVPAFNASFAAASMRWLMLALIIAGVAWAMWEVFGKVMGRAPRAGAET